MCVNEINLENFFILNELYGLAVFLSETNLFNKYIFFNEHCQVFFCINECLI